MILTIEIPNWDKYNPRTDRTNYSWFRFENGFFHDPKVFLLTDSQKVLFLFLLCEASKGSGKVKFLVSYAAAVLRRAEDEISCDLQRLLNDGVVTSSGRPAVSDGGPTYERTYETYETNETERDETDGATSAEARIEARSPDPEQDPPHSPAPGFTLTGEPGALRKRPDPVGPIDELRGIPGAADFLATVKQGLQRSWVARYGAEFIREDLGGVESWCLANPRKVPKSDWGRFLDSWLKRGWEKYRRGIPSRRPTRADEAQEHFERQMREIDEGKI